MSEGPASPDPHPDSAAAGGDPEWVVLREAAPAVLRELQLSLDAAGVASRVVAPPGCDPMG